MAVKENKKVRKYYLTGLVLWFIVALLVYAGTSFIESSGQNPEEYVFLKKMLNILVVFGFYGIPIILFFSGVVHVAAFVIDKIPDKRE